MITPSSTSGSLNPEGHLDPRSVLAEGLHSIHPPPATVTTEACGGMDTGYCPDQSTCHSQCKGQGKDSCSVAKIATFPKNGYGSRKKVKESSQTLSHFRFSSFLSRNTAEDKYRHQTTRSELQLPGTKRQWREEYRPGI